MILAKIGCKWPFTAIMAKGEENRLCLKFDFTSSKVFLKNSGANLLDLQLSIYPFLSY